jgi:signal transduction histidine kinase
MGRASMAGIAASSIAPARSARIHPVTLAKFIHVHIDAILAEWEAFALTLHPAAETMTALALRNHAREILRAIARDLEAAQTDAQQADKSKGWAPVLEGKETAAATHGALRHLAGFDLRQLAAEYRALRASVLKLWRGHQSMQEDPMLTEITRFNEAVDQALAESIASYSDEVASSRDTFLAILGHDLRSPLSAVSMSAHYLATAGRVVAEGQPALGRIRQSVLTMSLMVKDLLEYTRTRLGKRIPVTPLAYDVGQVCEAAHDEVQAAHPERVFDLEMDGDLRAEVDPARLGQVLSNLLNNAIQFGTPGSPISLSARGERGSVIVEVRNEGPAIPEDALQVIFNPLVQLRTETGGSPDPLSTSLGLGLYIAREIVMGHGGTLKVESSCPEGTVFMVELPRIFKQLARK